MRLVQICNVGDICGGTAACAWSITRALPECEHLLGFLSSPTPRTRQNFAPVETEFLTQVSDKFLKRANADLVILHNTAPRHVEPIEHCVSVQYQHSCGTRAAADFQLACSHWLASRLNQQTPVPVLHQPVPVPPLPRELIRAPGSRCLDETLIVGRICTPQPHKWPDSLAAFYDVLARQFPTVCWEFVGCPGALQTSLQTACRGRARFWPAGWEARSHLWRWHAMLYHHPQLPESFGRTVTEAMLAGCLPIVDAAGGFVEQIEDQQTGFLCTSIDDFVESLRKAHEPQSRWHMCRQARTAAEERNSFRAFAGNFRHWLNEVTQQFPAAAAASAPQR